MFISITLDVDLLSLRRRGLVRILVRVYDTSVFYKDDTDEEKSVSTIMVIKLKGFHFTFELEKDDFIPEPDFKTFMWRKPEDADNGNANGEGGGAEMGANKRHKNVPNSSPSVPDAAGSAPMQTAAAVQPVDCLTIIPRHR